MTYAEMQAAEAEYLMAEPIRHPPKEAPLTVLIPLDPEERRWLEQHWMTETEFGPVRVTARTVIESLLRKAMRENPLTTAVKAVR